MKQIIQIAFLLLLWVSPALAQVPDARRTGTPTAADAQSFMSAAETELAGLSLTAAQAGWVAATYITNDTEALSAEAQKNFSIAVQRLATEATRFAGLDLSPDLRRKLELLKLSLAAPPPADPAKAEELTKISVGLEADYGKGTYCRPAKGQAGAEECLQINELSRIMAESRDPGELLDVWEGWRRIAPPMKDRYEQGSARNTVPNSFQPTG